MNLSEIIFTEKRQFFFQMITYVSRSGVIGDEMFADKHFSITSKDTFFYKKWQLGLLNECLPESCVYYSAVMSQEVKTLSLFPLRQDTWHNRSLPPKVACVRNVIILPKLIILIIGHTE